VNRTVAVHTAADLQAALSTARLGDEIVLDAGKTYEGNFIVAVPTGFSGWVTVRTSAVSSLPQPGTRVGPGNMAQMAKIMSPNSGDPGVPSYPAIGNNYLSSTLSDMGVHHYRFIGIEFATGLTAVNFHVMLFSAYNLSGQVSPSSMPHDIIIDRCLVHGNDPIATVFPDGVAAFNGSAVFDVANGAIIDSTLYNLWGNRLETQVITCQGGPGPRLIQNNEISGGTEGFMCGGSVPPYPGIVTTDITVVHNYFNHPPAWQTSTPVIPYVKNLFELKSGKRVRITDNVFEGSWDRGGGQRGYAITLVPRTWQDSGYGLVPEVLAVGEVSDILVANNVVRNVGQFISTQGNDDECPTSVGCKQSARMLIVNNLVVSDTTYYLSPTGEINIAMEQDLSVKRNTILAHNTAAGGQLAGSLYGNRSYSCNAPFGANFEWSYNISLNGVEGDCTWDPENILVNSWTGSNSVTSNLVAGLSGTIGAYWNAFGHQTKFAASEVALGLSSDDHTLLSSSQYFGQGIGANLACFNEAAIKAGTPSPLCALPSEVAPVWR